jgi:hypothetical protein
MIVYPQGGAGRRPGTLGVANISDISILDTNEQVADARLIPMTTSNGRRWQILLVQCYDTVLESYKVRFVAYNVVNMADTDGVGLGAYNSYFVFDGELEEIQYAQAGDILFLSHGDTFPFIIKYTAPDTFELAPFYEAVPSVDQWDAIPMQPLVQDADATAEITVSAPIAGVVTLTPDVGDTDFSEGWIGRTIRFSSAAKTFAVAVTAFTPGAPGTLTATVLGGDTSATPDDYGVDAGTNYELSYWDSGDYGWPRTVTFFEGRLVFGGNKGFPDRMWFSQVDNVAMFRTRRFEQDPDFADPAEANDAFSSPLKSNKVGFIQWMVPKKTITVGTNFSEFIAQGPDQRLSIALTNFSSNAETPHGSPYAQAISLENTTIFIQRDRRTIRELVYSLDENSYQAANLNIIAEHIARKSTFENDYALDALGGRFRSMAFQSVPNGILWLADENGALLGLTRERQQQVSAWHYHELGGDSFLTDEDGDQPFKPKVKSLSVIQYPGPVEQDELWMVTLRGVKDGDDWVNNWFIERMGQDFEGRTIGVDDWQFLSEIEEDVRSEQVPVYLDCAELFTEADDSPRGVLTLSYASEGQEVSVVCNGYYLGEYTVDADQKIDISADIESNIFDTYKAIVGFNYTGRVVPVTAEVPAQLGTSQEQPRRVNKITVHFYRTVGASVGRAASVEEENTPMDDPEDVVFPSPENTGDPQPMYTGSKTMDFPRGYERRPKVVVESRIPLPMQITHIVTNMVVYE